MHAFMADYKRVTEINQEVRDHLLHILLWVRVEGATKPKVDRADPATR